MSKSKPTASSTLSLLNQMSTERKRESARKTAQKEQIEIKKETESSQEAIREEKEPNAEMKQEAIPLQTEQSKIEAEKPKEPETIDRAAFEALLAENRRMQAEKEAAERAAKEKEAEIAAGKGITVKTDQQPAATNAETSTTGVVKAGKTQFQSMMKERKNIRKNFLLTPSNSEHLREEAEELGTSMNDLLNLILEDRYN